MMEKLDPNRLKFMMDIDQALREVEKQMPDDSLVTEIKSKFYDLAGSQFDRTVLGEIHEYAIEDIIKRQAEGLYKNFPASIKKELIHEYIEMEHQMRRDKFYNFCLYLYKQVECCIAYALLSDKFVQKLTKSRRDSIFRNQNITRDKESGAVKTYIFTHGNNIQYDLLNYFDSNINKWFKLQDWDNLFKENTKQISSVLINMGFPNKLKIVLHQVKFKSQVSESEFTKDLIIFETIRQSRHLAHGGKMSATESKITEGIELDDKEKLFIDAHKNRYSNYLLYHGFLAEFVRNIPLF